MTVRDSIRAATVARVWKSAKVGKTMPKAEKLAEQVAPGDDSVDSDTIREIANENDSPINVTMDGENIELDHPNNIKKDRKSVREYIIRYDAAFLPRTL